jgi:2-oxoglutarate dehydrogenase complex dehydrogenase (E1) component-like enzyme
VHISWQTYFAALDAGQTGPIVALPPSVQGGVSQQVLLLLVLVVPSPVMMMMTTVLMIMMTRLMTRSQAVASSSGGSSSADHLMRALLLVRSYEMRGHNIAKVSPPARRALPPRRLAIVASCC